MNKKMIKNRIATNKVTESQIIKKEQESRIHFAATQPIKTVLDSLETTLRGLDTEKASKHRNKYGINKITKEKKKPLFSRLADAFINPFTIILFCLALVSCVTDMILPYFSLFGSNPDDFNCLTVVIIVTMVVISGTLRFIQESRSGNAAEKLLDMITTTCTLQEKRKNKK